MSIKIFKDIDTTQEVKTPQQFNRSTATDPGVYTVFTLLAGSGAAIASVQKVSAGVYTTLSLGTDYTRNTDVITLIIALGAAEVLLVLPSSKLDLLFSGAPTANRVTISSVYIAKDVEFSYDLVRLASINHSIGYQEFIVDSAGLAFTTGGSMLNLAGQLVSGSIGTGFGTLTVGAFEGRALVIDNFYVGIVLANNTSQIVISDPLYELWVGDIIGQAELFTIGALTFSPDLGVQPLDSAFLPVLILPALTVAAPKQKIWVRSVQTMPDTTRNTTELAIRLQAIAYVE